MNIEIANQGNEWLYSCDIITIVSPEYKLPIRDGIPWVAFSHENKLYAQLKADIKEMNGMRRTITETLHFNIDDLIPITGCSVQTLIKEIAANQFIPLQ